MRHRIPTAAILAWTGIGEDAGRRHQRSGSRALGYEREILGRSHQSDRRVGRRVALLVVGLSALLVSLASASAASAATLGSAGSTVFFVADPGEVNSLTVSRTGGNFVFSDTGATISPTLPCTAHPSG